ncbi:putative virion structural protein [Pseudomonas phage OBP]|uniref:putative virion structural protein n=1 Tax=Pseudomonas phage OBP TaxID=1124849 RepID=UPI000240D492|nr:putative virion structural protein [Pseudomonas phage OBP]AEV89537.1 putative virion structural protein [Pseudomonas phage OBP]
MLDINFLNPKAPLNFAGMEFMDYVSSDLYPSLIKFFSDYTFIDEETGLERINVSKESVERFHDIVFPLTGMDVLFTENALIGNMAVDVGYLSPHNLLNIAALDMYIDKEETNVARAMKVLKTDVLKGWVDTSTGKIGGDFSKVPITISVNVWADEWMKRKVLAKLKISLPEALAITVCHELGHVFTGFLYVTRTCFDAILPVIAIKQVCGGSIYGKERATIINDTLKELDIPPTAKVEEVARMEEDQLAVYFSKAINNRDLNRTLSIGGAYRGSEVLADLYAVRMGCPKAMLAAAGALKSTFPDKGTAVLGGITFFLAVAGTSVLAGFAGVIFAGMLLLRFGAYNIPNPSYDAPYRRMKNILRDTVVRLNDDKGMDKREKAKLLASAKEMETMISDSKPFFEGTGVQRLVGYILSGTDFRAADFEHYTEELIGHTLSLYKEAF